MERLVAILEENKKKKRKNKYNNGNLPTGGIFIGNNWIVIRIRLGGGGERISTNFEAVRTGLRLFDISNVPLLISYASTNINLSFESENQAGLSLSLSPLLSLAFDEGNKAKFVILHGIIRTREPLRPIHTIHYTRQGYLLRGCSFAYEAHPSPLPLVSLFTDTCSFHWHDARITEEDKPRTEDRSKI